MISDDAGNFSRKEYVEMKKYVLEFETPENYNATTKGVRDVFATTEKVGFEKFFIKRPNWSIKIWWCVKRKIQGFIKWDKVYGNIENNSVVAVLYPVGTPDPQVNLDTLRRVKEKRNLKIIAIVFDIDGLRGPLTDVDPDFLKMAEIADVLIIHNEKMKKVVEEKGIPAEKLVNLEIFDYLKEVQDEEYTYPKFERKITVAGTCIRGITDYIYHLKEIKNLHVTLYGPGYEATEGDGNVDYCGCVPGHILPKKLTSGFGLVWGGNSLDGCTGDSGKYLLYNNPNKFSMYLSSGIPVVIWDKAAEADFVKKYDVGITINSLCELPEIFDKLTEEEYNRLAKNVENVAKKLRAGYFLETALKKALEIVGE